MKMGTITSPQRYDAAATETSSPLVVQGFYIGGTKAQSRECFATASSRSIPWFTISEQFLFRLAPNRESHKDGLHAPADGTDA